MLDIVYCSIIIAKAALCNATIMIAGGKHRIYADRAVKIILCTSDVAQIIFCYSPEKESPVVCGIQLGKDVEILDCPRILAFGKGHAPPHVEYVLIILSIKFENAHQHKQTYR